MSRFYEFTKTILIALFLGLFITIVANLYSDLLLDFLKKYISINSEFLKYSAFTTGLLFLIFFILFLFAWRSKKRKLGRNGFRLFEKCSELKQPDEIAFSIQKRPENHKYITRRFTRWESVRNTYEEVNQIWSEKELAQLLRDEKWILIIGLPTGGKTHSVFHILTQYITDFHAIIPKMSLELTKESKALVAEKNIVIVLDDLNNYSNQGAKLLRYISDINNKANKCTVIATCRNGSELEPLSAIEADRLYERFELKIEPTQLTKIEKKFLANETTQSLSDEEIKIAATPGDIVLVDRKRAMKIRFNKLSPKLKDVLRSLQLLNIAELKLSRRRIQITLENIFSRKREFKDDSLLRDSLESLEEKGFLNKNKDENFIQIESAYVGSRNGVVEYIKGRSTISDLRLLRPPLKVEEDEEGLITLGRTLGLEYQQWDEAYKCFDTVISINIDNAAAWGNKGYILSKHENKYRAAIEHYIKALEIDNKYTVAWNSKGYAHYQLKEYNEALKCFNMALDLDKKYVAAWELKGYALIEQNHIDKGLECFKNAFEYKTEDEFIEWKTKAYSLLNREMYREAAKCFERAISINRDALRLWSELAYAFKQLGEYEESLRCYDQSLEMDENQPKVWRDKGSLLNIHERPSDALDCYNRSLEIDEDQPEVWQAKGYSFSKLGKYKKALDCYNRSLKIEENQPRVWQVKGYAFSKLGKYKKALDCYNQSLEIDEDQPEVWQAKGYSFSKLGKYKKALDCYNQSLEINGDQLEVWQAKGYIFKELEKYEESLRCYDQSLEMDENQPKVWRDKGSLLNILERPSDALDCYNRSLEIDEDQPEVWKAKGYSLSKLGKYKKALDCYNRSLKIDENQVGVWKSKGFVLDKLGKHRKAKDSYDIYNQKSSN